ncbi:MAG: bifunctional precorrin-2 dehydrogenase/sirohydrochlorin ferrochelatase [Clostridia bacterium]|nr:bifunctional precorrin-2 dehydrogenase/sirohydrochlorin ferrochelatase [Clostridia bacterium]
MAGKCFPLFVEIEDREILIFGATGHAVGKIRRFAEFGARVFVVAPAFDEAVTALEKQGKIHTVCGDFSCFTALLSKKSPVLVYALLESTDEAAALLAICQARGIPLNVEDTSPYCTFTFPSVISRGRLTVGICTGGASPTVSKKLREQIEPLLPDAIGDILDWLQALRPVIQQNKALTLRARTALWRRLADLAFAEDRTLTADEVQALIAAFEET